MIRLSLNRRSNITCIDNNNINQWYLPIINIDEIWESQ